MSCTDHRAVSIPVPLTWEVRGSNLAPRDLDIRSKNVRLTKDQREDSVDTVMNLRV